MKKSVAILCTFFAATANSQTHFSFSGIEWTDKVDIVTAKLKRAGFSGCGAIELMTCKARSDCTCNFSDKSTSTTGMAFYVDGRLSTITVSIPDIEQTRGILVKKYGRQQTKGNTPSSSIFAQSHEELTSRWIAPNGESLTLEPGFGLTYKSAESNKSSADKRRQSESRY